MPNNEVIVASSANQSTEKALTILEYLAYQSKPVKALEIAKALTINPSTALRYLTTLIACGYVKYNKNDCTYSASVKICTLSNAILSRHRSFTLPHAIVEQASNYLNETFCVTVINNDQVFYLDSAYNATHTLVNLHQVGTTAPLYCTASGKLFLSERTDEEIYSYVQSNELIKLTHYSKTTYQQLLEEVNTIRRKGYSIDNEETEIGVRCFAHPVHDHNGKISFCISVTGPSTRITDQYIEKNLPYLKKLAAENEKQLFF